MTSRRPLKVGFQTFGCRSNHADTIELQAALVERGALPCRAEDEADVYVINSCTVTDQADKDVLREVRKLRRRRPGARIVLTGCMASLEDGTAFDHDQVDAVVGAGRREEVLRAVEDPNWEQQDEDPALVSLDTLAKSRSKRPSKRGPSWRSISLDGEFPPALQGPGESLGGVRLRSRYHLRIQEGCENSCTFCIIPQTRGRLSSRAVVDLLDDLERLRELGYGEVVLTGTHIGGYGEDFGSSLTELLQAVERRRPVERIRLSSIDPNDISHALLEVLSGSELFCEHLHVCVQAFSDPILKKMNRKYRMTEVCSLISDIRSLWPGCTLGTDVICGFPGETRDSVDEQIELFDELGFAYVHVFPYSERSDTAAARLADSVDVAERRKRAARWRAVGSRAKRRCMSRLVGKELEFVIEQTEEVAEIVSFSGTSREFMPLAATVSADAAKNFRCGQTLKVRALELNEGEEHIRCELLNQESSA